MATISAICSLPDSISCSGTTLHCCLQFQALEEFLLSIYRDCVNIATTLLVSVERWPVSPRSPGQHPALNSNAAMFQRAISRLASLIVPTLSSKAVTNHDRFAMPQPRKVKFSP
jgi:hypothetical protein